MMQVTFREIASVLQGAGPDLFSKFDPLIEQRRALLATGQEDPFSLVMERVLSPTLAISARRLFELGVAGTGTDAAPYFRVFNPVSQGRRYDPKGDYVRRWVPELAHLGFDPLEHVMSWNRFGDLLRARHSKLKPLLMDQQFLAGIGNIYADEILFAAGLRYDRSSETLSSQEVRRLYRAMVETLQDAIKHRGSSLSDEQYRDLFGNTGEYQNMHKVYDREGQACRRCRSTIARVKFNGRSSFLCPQCQV